MSASKINPLLGLTSPLFQLAAVFQDEKQYDALDMEAYQQQVTHAFIQCEQQALQQQIDSEKLQAIKYALTALIDELVMTSSWKFRQRWMSGSLQLKYFSESSAGEGFFIRLANLRQGGINHTDVLEIYYLCLQLGFTGAYRLQGLAKLTTLQMDLHMQIDALRGSIDSRLAPQGVPQPNVIKQISREVPFWVIATVTCAIVCCIYLGCSIVMNHRAQGVIEKLKII